MLIDDTRKMCEFREIRISQVFRFKNDIYMKTDLWKEPQEGPNCKCNNIFEFEPNAVQLDTGYQACFFEREIVELLPNAKLVI